jgi:AraC-like DNA-binding protein
MQRTTQRAIAELCSLLFSEPERFYGIYFHGHQKTSWGTVVHRHEDRLQLDFTRGYHGTVICGDQSYEVNGAVALAFYPGMRHSFRYGSSGVHSENYSIHLRVPVTSPVVRKRLFPIAHTCANRDSMLTMALSRLYRLSTSVERDAPILLANLSEVLSLWPRNAEAPATGLPAESPADERIARAIWAVEENHARRPKLDDMARVAGLSHRHLVRLFRRLTGTTPHAYVTERLKIRAMELLCEKRLNVKQVAEALGFSSIYVFSRWFHRAVGLAPTRFMKDSK